MAQTPLMTSLGLFIIDENQYPSSWKREPEYDIIGGGLSYAVIGARIVSGHNLAKRLSGIVDMGTDFPAALKAEIDSWGTGIVFRENPDRLTTRGANVYREDGVRDFVYRSPKKRIFGEDVIETEGLIDSRTFHFCCAVDRCESTIDQFVKLTSQNGRPKPKFVFEPFPDICVPENLTELQNMLHKVDVFSPNLHEAASFFLMLKEPPTEELIRDLAERFFRHQSEGSGVVLRCGELGCYVKSSTVSVMLPAYHIEQDKVVDVTGGGNSFCGAFITSLELSGDWLLAAVLASVASGVVIEKLGMPTLQGELWNGISTRERLDIYINRNKEKLAGLDTGRIDWW